MSWTRNSQIKNALLNKSKFTKYGAGFLCFLFLPGSICANASVFFLWVLCSFLTISVFDAKLRQIPPMAKNRPTATCKNLLTKWAYSVKNRKQYSITSWLPLYWCGAKDISVRRKPYFSLPESIFLCRKSLFSSETNKKPNEQYEQFRLADCAELYLLYKIIYYYNNI